MNPTGVLSLISSTGQTNTDVADSSPIAGFSTSTAYTLSYQVNVPTGALSNLTLNGSPISLTFNAGQTNTIFDPNLIAYVGFYGSASNYGGAGTISNFELQAVAAPEPSTSDLLVAGVGMVMVIASRRRRV